MNFPPRPRTIGKDNFLKLSHKGSAIGIFLGDLHTYKSHWDGGRSALCVGSGCDLCAKAGDDKLKWAKFRFRANFVSGDGVAKVFESGSKNYDKLAELSAASDLSKTFIKITRYGEGNATTYDFEVIEKTPPQKLLDQLASVQLLPLS